LEGLPVIQRYKKPAMAAWPFNNIKGVYYAKVPTREKKARTNDTITNMTKKDSFPPGSQKNILCKQDFLFRGNF
jgi:hypothetical protein